MVDTDDSDVELIKTDGSDAEIDEAMDEEEEIDIPIEAAGQLQSEGVLTPAQSQDQISKVGLSHFSSFGCTASLTAHVQDEPVLDPSIKGARAVQAAKTVKGKKKDADLFESDIVSRWNRGEFGSPVLEMDEG